MVLKRGSGGALQIGVFENDVKMYGTQTWLNRLMNMKMFENDVKMYGS